jgi:hypothetical protein
MCFSSTKTEDPRQASLLHKWIESLLFSYESVSSSKGDPEMQSQCIHKCDRVNTYTRFLLESPRPFIRYASRPLRDHKTPGRYATTRPTKPPPPAGQATAGPLDRIIVGLFHDTPPCPTPRDGNLTRRFGLPAGSGYPWVPDTTGTGLGTYFDPWVLPEPDP